MTLKIFLSILIIMNLTISAADAPINSELLPLAERKTSTRCATYCENLRSYCTLDNALKASSLSLLFSAAFCDAASSPEIKNALTAAISAKIALGTSFVLLDLSKNECIQKTVAGICGVSWVVANISTWVAVSDVPSTLLQVSACLTFFSPVPVAGIIRRTLPECLTSRCGNWCVRTST